MSASTEIALLLLLAMRDAEQAERLPDTIVEAVFEVFGQQTKLRVEYGPGCITVSCKMPPIEWDPQRGVLLSWPISNT